VYASLDPADGLYWAYEDAGMVEQLVGVLAGQTEQTLIKPAS